MWADGYPKAGKNRYGMRTQHHLFSILNAAITFAYDEGFNGWKRRVEKLTPPKASKRGPNVKFATADETMLLVNALRHGKGLRRNAHLADAVDISFLTATRRQEVLCLHWADVHPEAAMPFAVICQVVEEAGHTKACATARKPNTGARCYWYLGSWNCSKARRSVVSDDLAFPTLKAGGLWHASVATQSVTRAAKALGVTGSFHSRRHGGFTHLLEQDIDINTVSRFAGHADVAMASGGYDWVSDELAQKQIMAVGGAIDGTVKALSTATPPPEVMLHATESAEKTEQPLDTVLQALQGAAHAAG
ncbi:MAG: tyrosine-type recombinase/integrase [Roseobacter sp.]